MTRWLFAGLVAGTLLVLLAGCANPNAYNPAPLYGPMPDHTIPEER